jgi:sec-independent protein translocase protein TatC
VWAFIAPGLYSHEKHFALPLVFGGPAIPWRGRLLLFCGVFPGCSRFIIQFAQSITPAPDIGAYLSFVRTMFVASALPSRSLVEVVLVRTGMVTVAKLWTSVPM